MSRLLCASADERRIAAGNGTSSRKIFQPFAAIPERVTDSSAGGNPFVKPEKVESGTASRIRRPSLTRAPAAGRSLQLRSLAFL